MKKIKVNYIVDFLAFLSFIVISFTGIVLYFIFPSGTRSRGSIEFLGMIKNEWISIHDCFALIFVILIIIHLIMHWVWIKHTTKNFFKK